MDIKEILDNRIICTGLEVKDKKDALKKMSNMLKNAGYIANLNSFLKGVYLRESQGCTGIGNYVANPHGKSMSVVKPGIAMAVLKNEIKWETLDGNGVKVIFLFAVGEKIEDAQNH